MSLPTEVKALQMVGYEFDNKAVCAGCGAEIEWWITPRKKKMPMSVVAIRQIPEDQNSTIIRHDRISHFAICPKAKEFRKPKPGSGQ